MSSHIEIPADTPLTSPHGIRRVPHGEVTVLIEDAVVGKEDLAVDPDHASLLHHRGSVRDRALDRIRTTLSLSRGKRRQTQQQQSSGPSRLRVGQSPQSHGQQSRGEAPGPRGDIR